MITLEAAGGPTAPDTFQPYPLASEPSDVLVRADRLVQPNDWCFDQSKKSRADVFRQISKGPFPHDVVHVTGLSKVIAVCLWHFAAHGCP
jgi:hypothetical protein